MDPPVHYNANIINWRFSLLWAHNRCSITMKSIMQVFTIMRVYSHSGHLCLYRKSRHCDRGWCALSERSEWNVPTSALSLNATLPHVWLPSQMPKTRDYINYATRAVRFWQCLWIHYFCSSKLSVATEKGIHLSHTRLRSMKISFLKNMFPYFHWWNHLIIF